MLKPLLDRVVVKMKEAGKLVVDTLKLCEASIKPGMTTDEINTLVHDYTIKHGAIPAPLNYHGFPKSVCTSVNDVICHGIPSDRKLVEGDIINVDDLPLEIRDEESQFKSVVDLLPVELNLADTLDRIESALIKRALVRAKFVQARAAELLDISRTLMSYKLKKYNLIGH